MYCTKCGAKLPHDARFCMNCGKPVSAIASAKAVELTGAPANAAVPTKVVESAGVSAKTTAPAAAPAKVAESKVAPAKAAVSAAAPAASSTKAVMSAFASEAADAGRNDASSSVYSSNASSQNGPARLGSLQSDSSFSDPSPESVASVNEPEKPCEAGACDASSAPQNSASSKHPETLRGAVNATKHRSRRRVPMVVLVALAMALAAGTAYAAYRVCTDVWLPAQQTQNEQTVEAPEEITYSVETRSMDVSVPVDPYDAPGKREAQKWYYPHIEASAQSDAVDKINAALEESMRTDVEKTNAAPDTAEDMGGAIVFICQYRSITLTYIDNDIVCVRDQRYDTGWGAHGSTTVTGCAYSLETGDPVDPVSAFGLTPEQVKSAVADAVTAYLATDPSDLLSTNAVVRDITNMCLISPATGSGIDVENPLDGCSHFYIASEGLVFATEDYQMGSYAYGRRELVVAPSDGSLAKVGDTVAIEAPMGFSGSGQASSK
ncbi:zinc-ribbon domain-containing protein [uncultured Slackia sp.]|uniref:zinc-ribbon domain-containing protein n=1 Tax=uncultured Slackia sp. TaxID=665903 RepID=UPI0025E57F2F|nr:zinc-ribbon domain-containing protein [uncultured Slackia sp.]